MSADVTPKTRSTSMGTVPADWEVVPLQSVCTHITKGSTPTTFGFSWAKDGVPFLRSECVRDGAFSLEGSEQISDVAHRVMARSAIRGGDILMTITGYIGRTCRYPTAFAEANINQHIARIRVTGTGRVDPAFVNWALKDSRQRARLERDLTGLAYPQISLAQVQAIPLPVPPVPEQREIAAILDTIDDAIHKTEHIVAKLKQMTQGLLHDLLTRGIDDNGELRDPERHPEQFKKATFGRIPTTWSSCVVGDLLDRIDQGWSPDCLGWPASAGEWGVLKTTAVQWSGYDARANKALPFNLRPKPEYEVHAGDVLMTRAGPNSRVGVVAHVDDTQSKLMLSDKLYRLVPNRYVDSYFLVLGLSGSFSQRHLSTLKTGLAETQENISHSIVRMLRFLLPSIAEQQQISSTVRALVARQTHEDKLLAKLRLLKQGLMEDLLTGRVRVTPLLEGAAP